MLSVRPDLFKFVKNMVGGLVMVAVFALLMTYIMMFFINASSDSSNWAIFAAIPMAMICLLGAMTVLILRKKISNDVLHPSMKHTSYALPAFLICLISVIAMIATPMSSKQLAVAIV
jgi:hypothetical protein